MIFSNRKLFINFAILVIGRGAGVVERGGLENRCTSIGVPWVRIPPSPQELIFCKL